MMLSRREKPLTDIGKNTFLVTVVKKEMQWGPDKQITDELLVYNTANLDPDKEVRDRDRAKNFLFQLDKDCVCFPDNIPLNALIGTVVPLLDFLAVQCKDDGYKYPKLSTITRFQANRSVDLNSLVPDSKHPIITHQIILGEAPDTKISGFAQHYHKWFEEAKKDFPADFSPLKVEYIWIPDSYLDKIANKARKYRKDSTVEIQPIQTPWVLQEGDSWVRFPAKIILGNGLDQIFVISWKIHKVTQTDTDGHYQYRIWPIMPSDKLIQFLSSLPTPVGLDIKNDISIIESTFTLMNPSNPLRMQSWVSLHTLAMLCGWKFSTTSEAALSMGVIGGLLDTVSTDADGLWCLEWDKLSCELQILAVGHVKFIYMTTTVLASILLRDVFPDPNAVWALTGFLPDKFVQHFTNWIFYSLQLREVNRTAFETASTQVDLINSIRARVCKKDGSSVLKDAPDHIVKVWAELLGDWPNIVYGGPRFLAQVRNHILTQKDVLASSGFPGVEKFRKIDNDWLKDYLLFGQPNVEKLDFHLPTKQSSSVVMQRHPHLEKSQANFNINQLRITDLTKLAKDQQRKAKLILFEFCRENPECTSDVIRRFDKKGDIQKEFWSKSSAFYEGVRLIHDSIHRDPAPSVKWLDDLITDRNNDLLEKERDEIVYLAEVLTARHKRYQELKRRNDLGKEGCRTGLVDDLPPIPKKEQIKKAPKKKSISIVNMKANKKS